jgi:bifunctional non-homologous end joining protein LigD
MKPLSNPEKQLFTGITKEEFMKYYEKIAPVMLYHVVDRPLTLLRFPNGIYGNMFFQKNASGYFPDWIKRVTVETKHKKTTYPYCTNKESLIYMAKQVAVFHIWTSRKDKLSKPDKMIFDLDPTIEDLPLLRKIALRMGEFLEKDLRLSPYIMTTGGKGFHIVVPIKRELNHDHVRSFAEKIAIVLEDNDPDHITTALLKDKREDKIFIDVNRNSPSQTSIAPYSVRALDGAPIAAPIKWSDLKRSNPKSYTLKNFFKKKKSDPWKNMFNESESITDLLKRLKA